MFGLESESKPLRILNILHISEQYLRNVNIYLFKNSWCICVSHLKMWLFNAEVNAKGSNQWSRDMDYSKMLWVIVRCYGYTVLRCYELY